MTFQISFNFEGIFPMVATFVVFLISKARCTPVVSAALVFLLSLCLDTESAALSHSLSYALLSSLVLALLHTYTDNIVIVALHMVVNTALLFFHPALAIAAVCFLCFSPFSPLYKPIHKLLFPSLSPWLTGSLSHGHASKTPTSRAPRGVFDLSHVALNLDVDAHQWGNLGCWTPSPLDIHLSVYPASTRTAYTTAAARLALRLYVAAGLVDADATAPKTQQRQLPSTHHAAPIVVDVGCGCGDQLMLLSKLLAAQRVGPDAVVLGVNLAQEQVDSASIRIRRFLAEQAETEARESSDDHDKCVLPTIAVVQGSGTDLHSVLSPNVLPAAVSSAMLVTSPGTGVVAPSPTHIVSLDTAYHFSPRSAFFKQAYELLAPRGTLTLTDIALSSSLSPWALKLVRVLAPVFSIPAENLLTCDKYEQQLQEHGFSNIRIEDMSENLLGFADFVQNHRATWGGMLSPLVWLKYVLTALAITKLFGNQSLRYVLVVAEK
jgi:cyclopropane fatty-acyl-phospholipid synthase-like methyltransferase